MIILNLQRKSIFINTKDMIDTVSIILERPSFLINKPQRFNPSAENIMFEPYYKLSNRNYLRSVNNPTKDDKKRHGYLPRLTLFMRNKPNGFFVQLKIEFSAPKLLFGNNFDELEDNDFDRLIYKLKDQLLIMGVVTTIDALKNAKVSSIHYSKNIILDKHLNSAMILSELNKVNISKRLDLSTTDFRNGGHALRYHTNSYQIVFYDKIKDLEKAKVSDKRAIERDNDMQLDLFKKYKETNNPDVIRMEIRLGNKRTIENILKKTGINSGITSNNLFNSTISKKILLYHFDAIFDEWFIGVDKQIKPEDYFIQINKAANYKNSKILQLIGAIYIIESIGSKGLRNLLDNQSDRSWYNLKSDLDNIDFKSVNKTDMFKKVYADLNKFNKLEMSDVFQSNKHKVLN